MLVDVVGLDKLTSALGMLNMFIGPAVIMGPPMAGFINDATGTDSAAFYAAGAFLLVAGILGFIVNVIRSRQNNVATKK